LEETLRQMLKPTQVGSGTTSGGDCVLSPIGLGKPTTNINRRWLQVFGTSEIGKLLERAHPPLGITSPSAQVKLKQLHLNASASQRNQSRSPLTYVNAELVEMSRVVRIHLMLRREPQSDSPLVTPRHRSQTLRLRRGVEHQV
jgi:hypothetical protein